MCYTSAMLEKIEKDKIIETRISYSGDDGGESFVIEVPEVPEVTEVHIEPPKKSLLSQPPQST